MYSFPSLKMLNMPNKLGQESAFKSFGISKRLFLASMAMQGLLSNSDLNLNGIGYYEFIAQKSFVMADELLKQEAKE